MLACVLDAVDVKDTDAAAALVLGACVAAADAVTLLEVTDADAVLTFGCCVLAAVAEMPIDAVALLVFFC